MEAEGCVIGVDGGGTHTRAILVGRDGEVLGAASGEGSNFQLVGIDGLEVLLTDLLAPLLHICGGEVQCLCLALAGAGRADEQAHISERITQRQWSPCVRVESDAHAALVGAHAGGAGVIAIAGTGSIVLGKGEDGRMVRAGGWGPLLGDEGSGYDMGLCGIKAVLAALDGCGRDTGLVEALRAALGLADWTQVVAGVYGGAIDRPRIAALAPEVFALAAAEDEVARDIVVTAGMGLGIRIAAVARRLDFSRHFSLAYSGGAFASGSPLQVAVESALATLTFPVKMNRVRLPPVFGAVLLAWERLAFDLGGLQKLERAAAEALVHRGASPAP